MKKFEYRMLSQKEVLDAEILEVEGKFKFSIWSGKRTRSRITRQLNQLGKDGWELINVTFGPVYLFKRELAESE